MILMQLLPLKYYLKNSKNIYIYAIWMTNEEAYVVHTPFHINS